MLKNVGFLAMWLCATAAAVAVAWAGVGVVDSELIDPAPATSTPPAGQEVAVATVAAGGETSPMGDTAAAINETATDDGAADAGADPAPASGSESTAGTSSTSSESSDSGALTSTGADDGPATSATTSTTTVPGAATTSTTTTTIPTSSTSGGSGSSTSTSTTTTIPGSSTSSTTTTTVPPTNQTFVLIGGTTEVRYAGGDVTVLWATPNPGFTVTIEPESPGWKVDFRSDDHRSRLDVWWSGGPQHSIEEKPG